MNFPIPAGPFDAALAASLLPALVALADRSALLNASSEADPDARAGKLEVGKQVSLAARLLLATLTRPCDCRRLSSGPLSPPCAPRRRRFPPATLAWTIRRT